MSPRFPNFENSDVYNISSRSIFVLVVQTFTTNNPANFRVPSSGVSQYNFLSIYNIAIILQDFVLKGLQQNGALYTDLKATYDNPRYKFVATLAQATGRLGLSAAAKEVAPGVTVGISGSLPDIDTAKLAVDYVAPHVTVKTSTSLSAAPKVDASITSRFAIKDRDVVGGAEVSYDSAKGAISKWTVGMGYTAADYQIATLLNDKQDVTALIAHSVRPDLTVGAEVVRNVASADTSLSAAISRRLPSGALQKIKVAHTGVVSVLHEQVLEGKSMVALSSQFDAHDLSKPPKFGVGMDFKY